MTITKTKSSYWEMPFPECDWFDYVESVGINNAEATVIEFNVPTASRCIIKWFGQGLSNELFFDTTTWRILVNDTPIRHYGNVTRKISTVDVPTEMFVYINKASNVKLSVRTTNLVTVTGRLKGWWWTDDLNSN